MINGTKQLRPDELTELLTASAERVTERSKLAARSINDWFESLPPPGRTPPARTLRPVAELAKLFWSVLVWLTTGAVGNHLEMRDPRKPRMGSSFAQLIVSVAWSGLFMGPRRVAASLLAVAGLLAPLLAYVALMTRAARFAGWVLGPYVAWIAAAAAFGFGMSRIKRAN